QRYQFDFLVHGDGPQPYRERIETAGGRVLSCPGPRAFPVYAACLFNLLRKNRYRVVHAHTHASSGFALAIAAAAGVPVRVFHAHTAEDERGGTKWKAAYFHVARKLIQRYATRGIAVSEEAAQPFFPADWRQKMPQWRVSPIGIDLEAFSRSGERDEMRRALKIPPGAIAVVHVGRFAEVKNHDLLIEIALELAVHDREVVFVLVGDGERRRFIEQEIVSWGLVDRFRLLGVRKDVERILKACDVLSSALNQFPRSIREMPGAPHPDLDARTLHKENRGQTGRSPMTTKTRKIRQNTCPRLAPP